MARVLLTRMCLCFLIQPGRAGQQVLLGRKKRGLGVGNLVGLGGKLEAGEDARTAAVREVAEESGVAVVAGDLVERDALTYRFVATPSWDQDATVFVASRWVGEPSETEEISPAWYDVADIPFGEMWDDARHWLPQVLAGRPIRASFTFGADLRTLVSSDVRIIDTGSPRNR